MNQSRIRLDEDVVEMAEQLVKRTAWRRAMVWRRIVLAGIDAISKLSDEERGLTKRRAQEPAAESPPAAEPQPDQPPAPPPPLVSFIRRADGIWFDMAEVATHLGLTPQVIANDLDAEEDILSYGNKNWIDMRGIRSAVTLSSDTDATERLTEWAETLERNP